MSEIDSLNLRGNFKVKERVHLSTGFEAKGLRLDVFLRLKLPYLSRAKLQKLCEQGLISILNRETKVKPSLILKGTEELEIIIPEEERLSLAPQEVPFELLFEDDDLAVIYKPAGVIVHPAPGHLEKTLVHGLLLRLKNLSGIGGALRPGIVHRLDKDTSGLMLVAKNDFSHQALVQAFTERRIDKSYLAILYGRLEPREGLLEFPLGRHPVNRKKMAVRREGKPAITLYRVLKGFKRVSFILAKPLTGRTHQLRVHFSHIGHPILGDPIYGGLKPTLPKPPRLMLHAYSLTFIHPRTGKQLTFLQEPPSDFTNYLILFEKEVP